MKPGPEFVEQFAAGKPYENLYKQAQPTDMSTLPTPRFDLLKVKRYATGSIQFSRGCPFQCEFCDIIVTFGRRPRMKRPEQVIEELDQLRNQDFLAHSSSTIISSATKRRPKHCCGRSLSGPKATRLSVAAENTEASINLADDPELLNLLYEANFRAVFIGIETPRVACSLKKPRNFRT